MRNIIIILSFTFILNQLLPITQLLQPFNILPIDLYRYPRRDLSGIEFMALNFLFNWLVPMAICTIFFIKSNLNTRIIKSWGVTFLYISITLLALRLLTLYLSTFIEGGGPTFVARYYFGFIAIPLKLLIIAGIVKVLISLEPAPYEIKE
ncbi:hypothetical protein HNW13_014145 [Shewanella sp. BF02_Schw]|uniref:hypothetical protein n=1 Tax=Alteromonadales TaxID=135622 RepID=UPI00177F3DEB|nr:MULTISPECIES: hypothetical protein [Alteromonadales]MBO1896900.1 hypothetical protein [Shewanella sp. BF02_Schw]MCG6202924.1 hypothetical protein [Psychromonas antarctica]